MAAPLPHSKQVAEWADQYLEDAHDRLSGLLESQKRSLAFRDIYWHSLSADAVIGKLSSSRWRPHSRSSRTLIIRVPFLAAAGQLSSAMIELRRFVELAFWTFYFTDHPVEWGSFEANPGEGFLQQPVQPIRYCAHRGITFYLDYAAERFDKEPSQIAVEAVEKIREAGKELNSIVHPAHLSVSPMRIMAFEDASDAELKAFGDLQRKVFGNSCICLAALFRQKFDRMPPMYRGHFDKLVGRVTAKRLRAGPFGLR